MDSYSSLVNSQPVVMVEFFATWCGHCRAMMPVIAQIRELIGDTVGIYQLDVDRNSELCGELGVNSTPTFIIYRRGEPVWRHAGEIDGNVLLQKLQEFMS